MAKFKKGDTVEIIDNRSGSINAVGHIGEITHIQKRFDGKWYKVTVEGNSNRLNYSQADEIRLVEHKPKVKERLAKAEETIAKQGEEINELKTIVEGLRKNKFNFAADSEMVGQAIEEMQAEVIEFEGAQWRKVEREAREGDVVIIVGEAEGTLEIKKNKAYKVGKEQLIEGESKSFSFKVYTDTYNRTPKTVDVYERIMPSTVGKTKTPNELRAEIIEKAKRFLEESKEELSGNRGKGYVVSFNGDKGVGGYICDLNFVVNEGKRTVVALLQWNPKACDSEIKGRGIAKCNPSDVFNSHIGKAIALGRALGLDVSEFEQAVQPAFAVGQQIKTQKSKIENATIYTIESLGERRYDLSYRGKSNEKQEAHSGGLDEFYVILNDTNAIYGGVE